MPTMSPGWILSGTICSRDSSMRIGVPADTGVAAASTKSHRGVITAVPKELSLGLTRWTLIEACLSGTFGLEKGHHRSLQASSDENYALAGCGVFQQACCVTHHTYRFRHMAGKFPKTDCKKQPENM